MSKEDLKKEFIRDVCAVQWKTKSEVKRRLNDILKAERKDLLKKVANKLVEIEKRKWKKEVHCTCLGYAIVEVFGEKYEKILMELKKTDKEEIKIKSPIKCPNCEEEMDLKGKCKNCNYEEPNYNT